MHSFVCIRVLTILRKHTKYANFKLGVQFSHNQASKYFTILEAGGTFKETLHLISFSESFFFLGGGAFLSWLYTNVVLGGCVTQGLISHLIGWKQEHKFLTQAIN